MARTPTQTKDAPDPRTVAVDAAVEAWLSESIRNSPLSRSTEAWNHLVTSLDDLKQRILKET